ncbi:NADH dehydrogenase [ubiquinone] 1 beta subcomplex subunit 7 [Primulina eburnea]|uniref:NADH dehydrogenase [ubiquinone] 1 beta subcomplex subunit 7 n=1 Tax=Primulina eburnea TaxID=1245227 RepID=UPI003C6CA3C7
MEVPGSSKKMIATQEEMAEAKVPIPYRDQCAHLLIPLNKCRHAEFFLPWKCETERHSYEKCEYELVMERMLQMQKIREREAQSANHSIPLAPKTAGA